MSQRRAPAWLTEWEYAHRGLHGEGVPENSLAAAEAAIQAGVGIECDIQMSRDGVPMVFHDWDLTRLVGIEDMTQSIASKDFAELSLLGTEQSPLSLSQFLQCVDARVPILIEVKSKRGFDVETACARVSEATANYAGDHAVMSFDPRVAQWCRRNAPKTACGLVMREDEYGYTQQAWQRRLAYRIAKPDFLAYDVQALPNPWVTKLRALGLAIATWTVNSPELRRRALENADAVISEGEGIA